MFRFFKYIIYNVWGNIRTSLYISLASTCKLILKDLSLSISSSSVDCLLLQTSLKALSWNLLIFFVNQVTSKLFRLSFVPNFNKFLTKKWKCLYYYIWIPMSIPRCRWGYFKCFLPNVSPITKDHSKIKYFCNYNIYFLYIFLYLFFLFPFGASVLLVYASVFANPNKVFILMMSK